MTDVTDVGLNVQGSPSIQRSPSTKMNGKATSGKVKLLCLTWNVGNAIPKEYDKLIPKDGEGYDIIAIGLQEATFRGRSIRQSISLDACLNQILNGILNVLNETNNHTWYKIQSVKRAQMNLFMFARTAIQSRIACVEKSVENTGLFHVLPNKGGILGTMYVDGTSLAFISSHLSAHEGVKNCSTRNDSTVEILGGVRARDQRYDPAVQFHHIFWMGDMNYRITFDPAVPDRSFTDTKALTNREDGPDLAVQDLMDEEYEDTSERKEQFEKIFKMIEEEDWKTLLKFDELNRELAAGRILNGFKALQPSFPPTFKRKRNVGIKSKDIAQTFLSRSKMYNVYRDNANAACQTDPESEVSKFWDMKRLPSYTDRILYKSLPGFKNHLTPGKLLSLENVTTSDHKPVEASFEIETVGGLDDILVLPGKSRGVQLIVSELKARNLAEMDTIAFGGGSDPYISISADPAEILIEDTSELKSSTILHELNPNWNDVLELKLLSPDAEGLCRNCHILISVWDADVVSADDVIGTITIPLSDIVSQCQSNNEYKFDGPLIDRGLIQGTLSGTITMVAPKFDPRMAVQYSMTSMSGGCCLIS